MKFRRGRKSRSISVLVFLIAVGAPLSTASATARPVAGQKRLVSASATPATRLDDSVRAATLTLTSPADGATDQPLLSSPSVNTGSPVAGSVVDKDGAALGFQPVELAGSPGVYFSASTSGTLTEAAGDDLVTSLTVLTNGNGQIRDAYVFYTRAGTATITAASGAGKATATVSTVASRDPYRVEVLNVAGTPTSPVFATGRVTDAFRNPVGGAEVDVGIGSPGNGFVNPTRVRTASTGLFRTWFIPATTADSLTPVIGTLYDTAGISLQTADAKPASQYLKLAGLVVPIGDHQAHGTIALTRQTIRLSATGTLSGGGKTRISGSFMPGAGVDLYAKRAGARSYALVGSVETDEKGDLDFSYPIKKTTKFQARSAGLSSRVATTAVKSTVTLRATAKGRGKAHLSANGSPSAKGPLKFYRSVAGKDALLKTMTSNATGNGKATVALAKGTRYVYVTFDAPGTTMGSSKTIKVKVK